MKKHKLPYGSAFDGCHFTQQIDFAIPILMKLGFNALEAHIVDRLIRFIDSSPKDVWTTHTALAYREGCSRRSVTRAISKAIKKNLIIVIKEARVPPMDSKKQIKLEDLSRHYNLVPLLLAMANIELKEEMEKEPEVVEEKPKSTAKFGKAAYNNPDEEDLPDEATRGWKNCKKCHAYGPPDCSFCEDQTLN